ncbi:hypothetical protein MTO96_045499 [Rhipicephalus appendiculatus]
MFLYALQGYFIEVSFTAICSLIDTGSLELRGCSSIWSLVIYSVATISMEKISALLKPLGWPLAAIAFAHMCCMYVCEFTSGCLLRTIGACSWDYGDFMFNVAGLVTLEYAPLWYLLGVIFEKFYAPNVSRLAWVHRTDSLSKLELSAAEKFVSSKEAPRYKENSAIYVT